MDIKDSGSPENERDIGREILELAEELYPICRSITGEGFRKTLGILGQHIPLDIHEVPTGTQVFDWIVPKEWNIRDAYVKNPRGEKIIDFKKSNLHIVSYSVPVHKTISLTELRKHLHVLPAHPDWVPYRTTYYHQDWGFCLSHNGFLALEEGKYEVVIDSRLEDGSLTYGEFFLKGQNRDEILISAHACHPSLANDNLSGVCLATMLAKHLAIAPRAFSYRFLFIPGTIGAITWLALNESKITRIKGGLVLTGLGDRGRLTYKKSRRGDAAIDRAAAHVLSHAEPAGRILEFTPYGYDERQYCSPGFNLPVGRISRTPYDEYPEYHSSADNMEFINADSLGDSYMRIHEVLDVLETDGIYLSQNRNGEPQLGRRGLYSSAGKIELALLWVLNLSDGGHSLLDIAERSGFPFNAVRDAAQVLAKAGLLKRIRGVRPRRGKHQ